jgi:hypothetical protein
MLRTTTFGAEARIENYVISKLSISENIGWFVLLIETPCGRDFGSFSIFTSKVV